MKRRLHPFIQRIFRIVALLSLFLALAYGWIQAGVIPTNEWVNFFSASSKVFGTPVPVGAVIRAFDPDGVQCGEFPVVVEGAYGVMPCYRDEEPPTGTPDPVDEGAEPGDVISFDIVVNGTSFPATPIPKSLNGTPVATGTPVTWTRFGDLWEVDLQVVGSATPSPTITPSPTPSPTGTLPPTRTPTPTHQTQLRVTKRVDPTTSQVGDIVTFTIRVVNDGPADAVNVAVMDPLPEGTAFASATPSQGSCIESGGTVVCTLGTLAAGAEATVVIQAVVNAAGEFTNRASVSANNAAAQASAPVRFTVRQRAARPVGGYGEPLSPLELVGPWIVLILGSAIGVILHMAFRRRATTGR